MSDDTIPMASVEDTADEHLTAAENFLTLAEANRAELVELHGERDTAGDEGDDAAQERYERKSHLREMFESAAVLADLHRKMAETWWGQPRTLTSPADVTAGIIEQLRADDAAHQGATFNPATDPEPAGTAGDLLTFGDGWFLYAVNDHASPGARNWELQYAERWLLVRHYAAFLRWDTERGTKPNPYRWDELYRTFSEHGEPVILSRPTPGERTTFYGPEPDPQPAMPPACGCCISGLVDDGVDPLKTVCASCDHIVARHARRVPERIVPANSPEAWEVKRHPRGGAEQWNG